MFEYLANRPALQHRHIAQEKIINGTDGLPARGDFEGAIGFVVRPLFNEGNILEYLAARPQQYTVKLRLVSGRFILGKQAFIPVIRLLRFPVLLATSIRRILSTEISAQSVPNLERKKLLQKNTSYFQTNILIADDGHAMLTDVGINSAFVDFICVPCGRLPVALTTRYRSPGEVCCSDDVPPRTTANDVYSLASSAYEVSARETASKSQLV
jgi:hypothetical protein